MELRKTEEPSSGCCAKLLRLTCLCGCIAAAVPALFGQSRDSAAHVLDVKGAWRLEGKTAPLKAGDAVRAGMKVWDQSNQQGDFITIVHDEDLSRQRLVCDSSNTNPCRNPIVVADSAPVAADNHGQWRGLVQAALSVLLDKPPAVTSHYALTLTRGKETVIESEEVVPLDAVRGLVLPAAPAEMPAGRYAVSINLAGEKSNGTEQTGILTSEGTWRPLPLCPPGLYEVTISNADGEQLVDTMLLVASSAEYQAKREAFDAMRSQVSSWAGAEAQSDQHLFLRTVLLLESRP